MTENISGIATAIDAHIAWFEAVMQHRRPHSTPTGWEFVMAQAPRPQPDRSPLGKLLSAQKPSAAGHMLLLLALLPHLRPDVLDIQFRSPSALRSDEHEELPAIIGGVPGQDYRGFLPTGLTFLYVIGGTLTAERLRAIRVLEQGPLVRDKVVHLLPAPPGDPLHAGKLVLDPALLRRLLHGD